MFILSVRQTVYEIGPAVRAMRGRNPPCAWSQSPQPCLLLISQNPTGMNKSGGRVERVTVGESKVPKFETHHKLKCFIQNSNDKCFGGGGALLPPSLWQSLTLPCGFKFVETDKR